MTGAPANPITAVSSGTSALTPATVAATCPTRAGSSPPSPATSATPCGGSLGPGSKVTGTPIASSGVMMSAKITAPSMAKRRIGCSEISTAISGLDTAAWNPWRWRISRYSGR